MTTKPVCEYTDEEIVQRLAFADRIMDSCRNAGKNPDLPAHLEQERQELLAEQIKRLEGAYGDQLYVDKA